MGTCEWVQTLSKKRIFVPLQDYTKLQKRLKQGCVHNFAVRVVSYDEFHFSPTDSRSDPSHPHVNGSVERSFEERGITKEVHIP